MNVRSKPGKEDTQAIVILDGCSAHNSIQEYLNENGLGWIHVITLPANVTSHYQPMDQGVISWVKKMYKYGLITSLLEIYDDPLKMEAAIQSRRNGGYNGIDQGAKPHVRDAMTRLCDCWDNISEEAMEKCWKKAQCMPLTFPGNDVEINITTAASAAPPLEDIATALGRLQLSVATLTDEFVQTEFEGTVLLSNAEVFQAVNNWDEMDLHRNASIRETIENVDEEVTEQVLLEIVSIVGENAAATVAGVESNQDSKNENEGMEAGGTDGDTIDFEYNSNINVSKEITGIVAEQKKCIQIVRAMKENVVNDYDNRTIDLHTKLRLQILAVQATCEEMKKSIQNCEIQSAPQSKINSFFLPL